MKKIDLNIKIDDLKPEEQFKDKQGFEIAKEYIELSFLMHQNEVDKQTGRPIGISMVEQRKMFKVLDSLDEMKKGIAEFEDDMLSYLKMIFDKAKWVGGTKIVVRVSDKLAEEVKDEKEN